MKYRTTLLAALGAFLVGGVATTACTSPDRAYGVATGSTSSGSGGASTGTGVVMMTAGTGTTTMLPCAAPSDCPGKETECQTRTCDNSFCGIGFSVAGKAITAQSAGDCQQIVCDGQGTIVQQVDNTDLPDDSNPCTQDLCTAGVPSHPVAPFGTGCGGALTCDGQGQCTGCASPGDCPGLDNDCQVRSCTGTVCGFIYQLPGTKVPMQTPADCKQNVCNGMGVVSVTFDGTDLESDGNDCTLDGCANGSPTHTNLNAGAACAGSDPAKTICNSVGACVACNSASDCKGQDTECGVRTCVAGVCGTGFTAMGTPVALQTSGDCQTSVCDGNGGVTQIADDTDVTQDSNPCNTESCSNKTILHTPVAVGTDCGAPKACDASGNCSGCATAAACAGKDTACQTRTCTSGVCGFSFTASGTPVAAQTAGDCKKNVCDGAGNTVVVPDNGDPATDGNDCTNDLCSNGSLSHPYSAQGASCSMGGGAYCNGKGVCGVCNPGDVDFNFCDCVHKTYACCEAIPILATSAIELSSESDAPGAVPDLACCCFDETRQCDSNGQWGVCN